MAKTNKPVMKECLVSIDLVNALKKLVDAMGAESSSEDTGMLRCPECRNPVKAFKGGAQGPHFEHWNNNDNCSFSGRKP